MIYVHIGIMYIDPLSLVHVTQSDPSSAPSEGHLHGRRRFDDSPTRCKAAPLSKRGCGLACNNHRLMHGNRILRRIWLALKLKPFHSFFLQLARLDLARSRNRQLVKQEDVAGYLVARKPFGQPLPQGTLIETLR